jgi:amidase
MATAKELDNYLKQHGKRKGPLHGLPISIKDNFNVVGIDTTVGFVNWVDDPAKYNATLVDILKELGAVLYVKTNVPTAMMIAETVNNVFGRTLNPLNRKLTSGGSSGGESALIAFGGSPLGVGTDIGGSLRIPAACTGIFTLRPSFGRFPTLRARSGLAGQEAVQSVNGPMARSLRDIELFSKTIVDFQPWNHDPRCLPLSWRPVPKISKLKFGVMWHDGIVHPTPPVSAALKDTVEKLKSAGHEVVEWAPEGHKKLMTILAKFFVADGGTSLRKILGPVNEPFRPEMQMYESAKDIGVYEMWQTQSARVELQKNYLDRWNAAGIDAILCE